LKISTKVQYYVDITGVSIYVYVSGDVILEWVMRWTLPITASMRQNSSFNQTIYIGNIQNEA
jgi:hypothetical protein